MKLDRNLSYEEELVLNLIPKSKPIIKNDIVDRRYIKQVTGFTFRDISYIIEELRKYYPICSSRGCRGYWLGDKEQALKFAKECRSHAEGLMTTAKNLESMFPEDSDLTEFKDEMLV